MKLHLSQITAVVMTGFMVAAGSASQLREPVNYDDPNLAMTSDYVGDIAANCEGLKGAKLQKCLVQNGLASGDAVQDADEISSQAHVAAKTTKTSPHSVR